MLFILNVQDEIDIYVKGRLVVRGFMNVILNFLVLKEVVFLQNIQNFGIRKYKVKYVYIFQ